MALPGEPVRKFERKTYNRYAELTKTGVICMFNRLESQPFPPETISTPSPIVTGGADSFARQESVFIAMNLCAMAFLVLAHLLFTPAMGEPASIVYLLFGLRMAMQAAEFAWLRYLRPSFSPAVVRRYALASVWMNVGFAFAVSVLAQSEDAHYTVLMLLPLTAAAFRFSLPLVAGTVLVASALSFAELWIYFRLDPPVQVSEYFEALSLVSLFVIVSIMVWLFAQHLRREETSLKSAYDELQRTRDRLIAEEKLAAIGRLSSAIAHEIRNPVAMVSSSLALAKKSSTTEELRSELCEIASKEAARLERITNDFLAYARTREPDRRIVRVEELLSYVADVARGRSVEHDVQIVVECDVALCASLDEFLLQQSLLNLVLNAIDATDAGDSVIVAAVASENGVLELSVQNAGKPIHPEQVDKIFEPFFTTKPSGTGLGLAIARNIARVHGGDLTLACNQGNSVRFLLRLPADSHCGAAAVGAVE